MNPSLRVELRQGQVKIERHNLTPELEKLFESRNLRRKERRGDVHGVVKFFLATGWIVNAEWGAVFPDDILEGFWLYRKME